LLNGANYQLLNWIEKPDKIFELIKNADIVIIDSYFADISFYEKISKLVKIPVYIYNNKRRDYPKGVVVNGSIYAEELNYPSKDGVVYLIGAKYILLRKIFWDIPEKNIKDKIENVMITFGGGDTKNLTPKILKFLNEKYSELKKNVIIGRAYLNVDEIKKVADKNTNLIYFSDASTIKKVMLESDMAISSGGQTLNELARVGVPTVGICVADNQRLNILGWEKIGFLTYIGNYDNKNILINLKNAIEKIIDYNFRKGVSILGRELVGGKGSLRLVNKVILLYCEISINYKNRYEQTQKEIL